MNAYTPTHSSSVEVKDKFYKEVASVISRIPNMENLHFLGDFNATVGADSESWLI